jgi:hypothetical protein
MSTGKIDLREITEMPVFFGIFRHFDASTFPQIRKRLLIFVDRLNR